MSENTWRVFTVDTQGSKKYLIRMDTVRGLGNFKVFGRHASKAILLSRDKAYLLSLELEHSGIEEVGA